MHRSAMTCVIASLLALCATGVTVDAHPDQDSLPFKVGEKLTFSVRYGFLRAGIATMEVAGKVTCGGGECLHIVSEAHSTMPFSLFYEVEDRVESFIDAKHLYTWRYEKTLREGSYRDHEVVVFDQQNNLATYPDGKKVSVPQGVQDVLSSLYYVRTMEIEVGKSIFIDNHADEKNYALEVRVLRIEEVKVPAGTYQCYVLEPILRAAGIFQHKGRLTVWLSTDPSHIPVMMKSKIVIGSIDAVLTEASSG